MKRRTFFKNTTFASIASLTLGTTKYSWLSKLGKMNTEMSRRNLIPFFVMEDILSLIQYSVFSEKLIDALVINKSFLHLAAADKFSLADRQEMMKDSLNKWSQPDKFDEAQTQIAYLIGSVLYPGVDQLLPYDLASYTVGQPVPPLTDEAIYFDVKLMQEIHLAEPYRSEHDHKRPSKESLEELFHLIRQRNLIRTHTFRPDFKDVEPWLENFLRYHHLIEEENQRYAHIYLNPDVVKPEVPWKSFYDANNDIISLARSTQMGISEATIDLEIAVEDGLRQSTYARILSNSMKEISQWNQFLLAEIDQSKFIETVFNDQRN